MNFYTDTFTGKSIEGIVPYQSINLDTASVQLYWPNQTLPTAVSNQYVGSVTECVKINNGNNSIILPSSALMPAGTSFILVCSFIPTANKNFSVQVFGGSQLFTPTTAEPTYGYIFYTKDNNNLPLSWGILLTEIQNTL